MMAQPGSAYRILLDGDDWRINGRKSNEWIWARTYEMEPTRADWYPATVPGSVQDDLLDQGRIPDPDFEFGSRDSEWAADRDWTYQKSFDIPEAARGADGARWIIRFHGVDYHCHVYLNGRKLGENEGTFIPFEVDATDAIALDGPNRLAVVVERAPDEQFQIGYTGKVRTWKPRFAYGWDWCTRLIPLGSWKSVELVRNDGVRLHDVHAQPDVQPDGSGRLRLTVAATALRPLAAEVTATVRRGGAEVAQVAERISMAEGRSQVNLALSIPQVELWWPNGHGEQPLYDVTVEIVADGCSDACATRVGFRTFRMVDNEGAPEGALPYTVEINGKRIYIKGWNWAPIHHLYRRQTPERYRRLIRLAKEAHVTMLRVWGGGLLEREVFYEACDEAGILVWQSFCQSSSGIQNEPPKDPEYMNLALRHAESMIPQRRNHPSLIIWCGGNELMYDDWRPLGSDHPTLAVLKDAVARLDPGRYFIPTSASGPVANASLDCVGRMHDVHGPWMYAGLVGHYELFNGIDALLHAEFGSEGTARLRSIRAIIAPEHTWPPDASNEHWLHHGAWWISRDRVEAMFGPFADIERFIAATQFIHAEGLRYAIESNRRRKWHCSGTMPWQFNETWPNTSGNFSVDYYCQPRPGYYWIRSAHRPVHVSAEYDALARHGRGDIACRLFAHNSRSDGREVRVTAELLDSSGARLHAHDVGVTAAPNATTPIGEVRWQAPEGYDGLVLLRLTYESECEPPGRNEYLFSFAPAPELAPMMSLPPVRVAAEGSAEGVRLINTGDSVAFLLNIEPTTNEAWVVLSDSYFCLLPGEARLVTVDGPPTPLAVWGLNAPEVVV